MNPLEKTLSNDPKFYPGKSGEVFLARTLSKEKSFKLDLDKVVNLVYNQQMSLRELPFIDLILRDLCCNNFEVSSHALKRMKQRNIRRQDLVYLGSEYLKYEKQNENKYRIIGFDIDDCDLEVVCVYELGTLIVTVI